MWAIADKNILRMYTDHKEYTGMHLEKHKKF